MKLKFSTVALAACLLSSGLLLACSRAEAIEEIPAGTEVTVVTQDGSLVRGKIATVNPEVVTLTGERPNTTMRVVRKSVAEVKRSSVAVEEPAAAARGRSVTIPDNTVLNVTLESSHASDTSRAEDAVRGTLDSPVVINDVTVIPSGSVLTGHVTSAQESGKVKGRAELGLRFDRISFRSVTYDIATKPLYWVGTRGTVRPGTPNISMQRPALRAAADAGR
ncbi:MAG: hypothetical protein EXQ50_06850 [Acidobacteria bacterium]|nr:hypothetical protein [Acidobacteriota bacterium]